MPREVTTVTSANGMQHEIDRLRSLVGPLESSYEDLRREVDRASEAVREAESANGRLRGEIAELRVALHRAEQDRYHLHRVVLRPALTVRNALRRRFG